jgi:protein-disulfide isomerase
VLEKYPLEVKLVHKFIPAHDFTLKAATAALAAEEQGKFWEFHDKLFENQSVLNEQKLIEIAGILKLNMARFRKKINDPALKKLINSDYEDAKKLGITATPWVYVNGRHLKERSLQDFVDAIDKELRR